MPFWPQFYYGLCIGTRTQAYLEKGLGVDFYKLPSVTAMRILSEVRESIVWILKLFSERQRQSCTERIRLSVPLCWVHRFAHKGVSIGTKNFADRVRFTRALLESKDLYTWFCLPMCMWVSGLGPSSVETAPEKRSPGTAFPPGWETQFIGGKASEPPAGKKRPYCPYFSLLQGKRGLTYSRRSRLPECVRPD